MGWGSPHWGLEKDDDILATASGLAAQLRITGFVDVAPVGVGDVLLGWHRHGCFHEAPEDVRWVDDPQLGLLVHDGSLDEKVVARLCR